MNDKLIDGYKNSLKAFTELSKMVIDNEQLNIALKTQEKLLKYYETVSGNWYDTEGVIQNLSDDGIEKLAYIVSKNIAKMYSKIKTNDKSEVYNDKIYSEK